jgi:hypothetical protein
VHPARGLLNHSFITQVAEAVSERKLQANRSNAKLSTGPKNTRSTRYNALKHELLSQAAVIHSGDAKEDPRELESLLEKLREDLEPEGAMEEILVDRIAACYWRLRRAQRAEAGEISEWADSPIASALISTGPIDSEAEPRLSLNLPQESVLAKILRYETAIERQMYRALKELRDLRAFRLGGGTVRRRMILGVEEST